MCVGPEENPSGEDNVSLVKGKACWSELEANRAQSPN